MKGIDVSTEVEIMRTEHALGRPVDMERLLALASECSALRSRVQELGDIIDGEREHALEMSETAQGLAESVETLLTLAPATSEPEECADAIHGARDGLYEQIADVRKLAR